MHQIAKINHCETSILGGNGIAVKLVGEQANVVDAVATGIERCGLPLEYQGTDYLPCKKPAGLPWYSRRPEQQQERVLGQITVMFGNCSATF